MSYASIADMRTMFGENELVQLTDSVNGGLVDDAVVQYALDSATSEADSYLPVAPSNPNMSLTRHVAAIARFYMHKDVASDEVRQRYDDAVAWLKMAAKGAVSFDDAPPVSTVSQVAVSASMQTELSDSNGIMRNGRVVI